MTKLSWKKSIKMIYFKMYRSKIHITQHFMLILMQKKLFHFQGTVTNKKVTERERYKNERITVMFLISI